MADLTKLRLIYPGQFNPDLVEKSGTPIARPGNIIDNPMAVYSKALSNALGPNIFEGVSTMRGVVLLAEENIPDAANTRTDPDSSTTTRTVQVMIPELHLEKPNPFLASSLTEYTQLVNLHYPTYRVVDDFNVVTRLSAGNTVHVTFQDANKSVGIVTSVENADSYITINNQTFSGNPPSANASNNLGNQQVVPPNRAITDAAKEYGVSPEFIQQELAIIGGAGARLTSAFGPRIPPPTKNGGHGSAFHKGIDIGPAVRGQEGGPVGVPVPGEVIRTVKSDSDKGFGNYVEVLHNDGTVTVYAHLQDIDVEVGQKLERGDSVGGLGNTGNSGGAHVHWEVRTNARGGPEKIDGVQWLAQQNAGVDFESTADDFLNPLGSGLYTEGLD